jgi:[pyruvate, water dikinase]-phosphate phosphotransferase / [pyruvate, water dikinase] kinase
MPGFLPADLVGRQVAARHASSVFEGGAGLPMSGAVQILEYSFMVSDDRRPVYFLSDSTGITAETLGNTLLTQFPANGFDRLTIPFITTAEQAKSVVKTVDGVAETGPQPIVFSTAVSNDIRQILATCKGIVVDLIGTHVGQLERALGTPASGELGRAHGLGNAARYRSRMAAVEYAMEHDDGQSLRALEKAQVILVAPSRCGKTPTTMYLALQHGIFAANFPLVDEDFEREGLPEPLRPFVTKCFGLSSNPLRLSQIRTERRSGSSYSSLRQCSFELRSAEHLYMSHRIPYLNSATVSVEEMAATILQRMNLKH